MEGRRFLGWTLIILGLFSILFGIYEFEYRESRDWMGWRMGMDWYKKDFSSNGERIYFTAESNSGKPISFDMGMMRMSQPMMNCVSCHGTDGKGGTVQMMMGFFKVPNITYEHLTEEHEEEHPPYTDELIKRAITHGLNPAGESLEFPMPRWSMSDEDLDDLIEYLKILGSEKATFTERETFTESETLSNVRSYGFLFSGLILILVGVYLLLSKGKESYALNILEERYAKGEISAKEFEEMKEILRR